MESVLEEFEKLLSKAQDLGGSIELLLLQVEPEIASIIELCAIPHQFDPQVLQVLSPELDSKKAETVYEEITNLSIVISLNSESAIHDEARLYLFRRWFNESRYAKFQLVSLQLASFYEKSINDSTGILKETLRHNHMYHLMGADPVQGFMVFERLFDSMWHQYRLDKCDNLLKLVNEYSPILSHQNQLWLKYYKGKVAAERNQLSHAEQSLSELLADTQIEKALTVKAGYRLGTIYSKQRNWPLAIEMFNKTLEIAQTSNEHHDFVDEIMHVIGIVYRESGELVLAESYFKKALLIATQQHDLPSMANAFNSMGSLLQKCGDTNSAISMYKSSLEVLAENNDKFRPAQVYNNLGMSYIDIRDWGKSIDFFEKSLEIKTMSGDTRGRALTLCNLARVYFNMGELQKAIATAHQSITLFTEVKDFFNVAKAKCNLGKLYRNMNEVECANQMYAEALKIFEKLDEKEEATSVQHEIECLQQKQFGLPWYVWGAFILFVFFIVVLISLF